MSSLAAACADGFYFPPDYRPEYGGLSKFAGSKGANQYQQYGIIRFELPFDGWCLGCQRHMCKGLRFNAKKEKEGKYFTTQIYSFHTKCPTCNHRFVIKTDPEHDTYDYAEGLRPMIQDFVPEAGDSLLSAVSAETRLALDKDPIFKLQHGIEDALKSKGHASHMEDLISLRDAVAKHDFDANCALRKLNRQRRTAAKEAMDQGHARGLSIPLAPSHAEDFRVAREAFRPQDFPWLIDDDKKKRLKAVQRNKMQSIRVESIFAPPVGQSNGKGVQGSRKRELAVESLGSEAKKIARARASAKNLAGSKIDVADFTVAAPSKNSDQGSRASAAPVVAVRIGPTIPPITNLAMLACYDSD